MKLGLCPSHCTSTVGYLCGRESFSAGKASLARPQSIKANCNLCQFTLMCWAVSYGSSEADSKMIKLLLLQGELLRDQGWMTAGHSNLLRCCTLTHKNLWAKALRRKEGHRDTPWVMVCFNTDPVRHIHVYGHVPSLCGFAAIHLIPFPPIYRAYSP